MSSVGVAAARVIMLPVKGASERGPALKHNDRLTSHYNRARRNYGARLGSIWLLRLDRCFGSDGTHRFNLEVAHDLFGLRPAGRGREGPSGPAGGGARRRLGRGQRPLSSGAARRWPCDHAKKPMPSNIMGIEYI